MDTYPLFLSLISYNLSLKVSPLTVSYEAVIEACFGGEEFALFLARPFSRINFGEEGVGIGYFRVDFRYHDFRTEGEGGGLNLSTTHHDRDFCRGARRYRSLHRGEHLCALCLIDRGAGDHDVAPSREGALGNGFPCLAPHDYGVLHSVRLEMGHIFRQSPRQCAGATNRATMRHSHDTGHRSKP